MTCYVTFESFFINVSAAGVREHSTMRGRVFQQRACIFHQSAESSSGGKNNGGALYKLVCVRGVMQPFCPRRRAGCIATKVEAGRLTKARATLTLRRSVLAAA